jgi:hypothetical protein
VTRHLAKKFSRSLADKTKEKAVSWYSVRVIYKSAIAGVEKPYSLREESVRVFTASNDDEARTKRETVARAGEHSYKNESGEIVQWLLETVDDAQHLCDEILSDGTEVYSRLFRPSEED